MKRADMLPHDEHNQTLLANVHPMDWTNPEPSGTYNLVVIGAGTAGLIPTAVAGAMGAKVALIERGFMGGDCLNVGCVPSKGLIRGARAQAELQWLRDRSLLAGDAGASVSVPFHEVMARLRRIRAEISSHDSTTRYRDEIGADVYMGQATFTGKRTVQVTGDDGSIRELRFAKAIIATGARAAAPPFPGLETTPYLTNETIFTLTELPSALLVVGAGPIGCEMAQSFARLGSNVHQIEKAGRVLPREDADVAERVQNRLRESGVNLHLGASVASVSGDESVVTVHYTDEHGTEHSVSGDKLLVAIGRAPNLDGLDLERAGVKYHKRGVDVNDYMQTANRRIYAAGDVASPYQFTHMAEATGSIAVQNALFARTGKASKIIVPWCTYTTPEVAHVGLGEQDAARQGIEVDVYTHELSKVDRARLDGEDEGFVKLLTGRGKTKILGATIVAEHAGEMMGEIVLAMQNGFGVDKLASVVHPYPTQAEAVKRAAAGYLRKKLTPRTKKILGVWFRWSR